MRQKQTRRRWEGKGGGRRRNEKREKNVRGRVGGLVENRANLGLGHAREISAYGEITPRREILPQGEFRRAHVEIRYGVISILKVTTVH